MLGCTTLLIALTVGSMTADDAARISPAQRQALDKKLDALVAEHTHWALKKPLAELLDGVEPAVQVELLLPHISDPHRPNWTTAPVNPAVTYRLGTLHEHSIDPLIQVLRTAKDPGHRAAAAFAIERCGHSAGNERRAPRHPWGRRAVTALVAALKDDHAEVRKQAARALGSMRRDVAAATDALTAALDDPDEWVAFFAMTALEQAESDAWAAVPKLRRLIRDNLHRHGDRVQPHWNYRIPDTLKMMGPAAQDAVPELLMILASKDTDAHTMANSALFWIVEDRFDARHAPLAIEALAKSEYASPAWMLGKLDTARDDAAEALVEKLRTGELGWATARQTAEALGKLAKGNDKIDSALHALTDTSDRRRAIAAALAIYRRSGQADVLLARLSGGSGDEATQRLWAHAVEALGRRAAPLADRIRIDVHARSPWQPLKMCRAYQAATGQCDRTLDYLARQMQPTDANAAHDDAAGAIRMLGPMATPALDSVLIALHAYEGYSSSERFHACQSIKAIGPSRQTMAAIKGLEAMFDRPNNAYNRRVAAEALWLLTHDEAPVVDRLVALLDERGRNAFWVMRFLEHMGPRAKAALPTLRRWTEDENPHYRRAARRALAAVEAPAPVIPPDRATLDRWFEQLGDADPLVGVEAIWRFVEAGDVAHEYLRRAANLPLPTTATTAPRPIARLIDQLDDNRFERREAASWALRLRLQADATVRDQLQAALQTATSAEVKLRLEALLEIDIDAANDDAPQVSAPRWPHDNLADNRRLGRAGQAMWLIERRAAED